MASNYNVRGDHPGTSRTAADTVRTGTDTFRTGRDTYRTGTDTYRTGTGISRNMPPLQTQPGRTDRQTDELIERMQKHMNSSSFFMRPLLTENLPDGSTRFQIYKYPAEALANMNNFRHDGSLCDIQLNIQGQSIRGHKVVLAASSEYFRAMFTHGMREASCSEVTIREPNISPATLKILIDFAYTNEVIVSRDNVQPLLVSAIFLEMNHVVDACTMFIEKQLDPSNCIGFANFASRFGCLDLEAKAKKFIHDNFCEVIKYDEFLTLATEDMIQIVQQDELNVKCESQVFRAVIRWVENDTSVRVSQLSELLDKVRLTNLAPCFLESQLEKCTIIKKIPHCEQLLLTKLRKLYTHSAATEQPRRCGKPEVVFCAGGFYGKGMTSLASFECYNPTSKIWTRLADLPRPICGPGVTSLQGMVYIIGGKAMRCGQSNESCQVMMYDPAFNSWSIRCPMSIARHRVSVAVLDGMIYAVGGSEQGTRHKSAERYSPDSDSWEVVAPMTSVRMSGGVAVVNRLLYVVGGFDGLKDRLSSVECFHPEENEWSQVEPLNVARSGAGVAVLGGCIYAVGGFDGSDQLRSVERYDPMKKVWEMVAPLQRARSGLAVSAIGNKLLAFGGYDGRDFLPCVESYDPEVNEWTCETVMMCPRSGHGVVVGRQPDIR